MKKSLSYQIALLIIKLKGLKKQFSKAPIDFKTIRKEDIHHPKGAFFKKNNVRRFTISNTLITEIEKNTTTNKLLIFIHGGAFISGPAQHHWDTIKTLAKHTNYNIWMCNYPKAPENNILEISNNIDLVYKTALKNYKGIQITLMGDSAGGTLITALTQRLIKKTIELPFKILLISPVMDATMSNPEIALIDKIDPVLSRVGVLSAKKMCSNNGDLDDVMLSPIYGSFNSFPKTILFIAEHDITYPDQELAITKMMNAKVELEVVIGEGMLHIWPLLPFVKEAKIALKAIIDELNEV